MDRIRLFVLVVCLACMFLGHVSAAGEWPQILGPNRNGHAENEDLKVDWSDNPPQTLWSRQVGLGYAGAAVADGRVVVFHRQGDQERVEALDVRDGKTIWKADYDALYRGGYNYDTGPRCVPVIYQDRVYVFGAAGALHCIDLKSGAKIWTQQTQDLFNITPSYFGAGSTPIVADEKLIVNVGGRSGAGIVAFALDDGKVGWKATDEGASYSSPILTRHDGQPHVVFAARLSVVSVAPSDGDVQFRFDYGARGPTVTAATPVAFDDYVFFSAAYGVGARLSRLTSSGVETVWANDESMSSQYTTSVYHDGHLYGVHGREDYQNGELRCIEATTGKIKWSKTGFGIGHIILADEKLLIAKNDGQIMLVKPSPDGYEPIGQTRLFENTVRALPALANGRLYERDNTPEGGTLKCVAVGEGQQ